MKYLLDVNALIALGLRQHVFHHRVADWAINQAEIATCSIVELGFVRVISQAPSYGLTLAQCRETLLRLRQGLAKKLTFIADDQGIAALPAWVRDPKQITDGHLVELAKSHGGVLATLDSKVPDAYLIPH